MRCPGSELSNRPISPAVVCRRPLIVVVVFGELSSAFSVASDFCLPLYTDTHTHRWVCLNTADYGRFTAEDRFAAIML